MVIQCDGVSKKFRSYKKAPGFTGAVKNLFSREYVDNYAVKNFSMQIARGEFVGLLGPNGAGKTTLMKMLTGIIVPSDGEMQVLDENPWQRSQPFRKKIALVMGQKSQLWWDITALDSFLLLQKYYEIDQASFKKRLNQLTDMLQVGHVLHTHVRKLSLGERMKMELMACLLHSPEVIFLDEPTIGLDIIAQKNIRKFLLEYHREHNTTFILTSHYMADVQSLCSRIVLILGGEKHYDGSIDSFEQVLGKEKFVSFEFSEQTSFAGSPLEALSVKWNGDRTKAEIRIPEDRLREVSAQIIRDYPVVEFNTDELPVERVMQSLLQDSRVAKEKC